MGPLGWPELAILFVIVLIIFGPKSLPKIGQAMGKGIREFKSAAKGLTDMDDDDEPEPQKHKTPSPQVSQNGPTIASAENQTTEHHV